MPPEVLSRLFTPFFTTKPVGVGTGLGLSICHRIVTSFGGSIDVTSELGKGTSFRISLPPARAEASENVPDVAVDVAARRRGRILVVDDEPTIAKAIQRTLATEHEVVAIGSADEALKRITAGERFDVILCDLMMPQMTGMDLHAELSRVALEQAGRMIFLTGGAFTPQARAFLDKIPNQRVEKPFDVGHLRSLINDRIVLV
jgi:CheY-like chemotaxis protein